jgi:hypothetical protein
MTSTIDSLAATVVAQTSLGIKRRIFIANEHPM